MISLQTDVTTFVNAIKFYDFTKFFFVKAFITAVF